MLVATVASADHYFNSNGASVGHFSEVKCGYGVECTKTGGKVVVSPNAPTSIAVAATETLTSSDCGKTYYENGAVTVKLPLISSSNLGCIFTFVTQSGSTLTVNPDDSDYIRALTNAAGDAISNATVGNNVTLKALVTGKWIPIAIQGTWTDAN